MNGTIIERDAEPTSKARVATTPEEAATIRDAAASIDQAKQASGGRATVETRDGRKRTGLIVNRFFCLEDGNVHGGAVMIDDEGDVHGIDYADVTAASDPETPDPPDLPTILGKNYGAFRPTLHALLGIAPATIRDGRREANR